MIDAYDQLTKLLEDMPDVEPAEPSDEYQTCDKHGEYLATRYIDGTFFCVAPSCPVCAAEKRVQHLIDGASIPPRYQAMTVDSWQPRDEKQAKIKQIAERYIADIDARIKNGTNILLLGGVGTGKTHLACGIGRAFLSAGHSVKYVRVKELISQLRSTWDRDSETKERDLLRAFIDVDLLILDEVGGQYDTEAERQQLFEVIDGRYENMRPTIAIGNLTPDEMQATLGERSYDRLRSQSAVLTFDWSSRR